MTSIPLCGHYVRHHGTNCPWGKSQPSPTELRWWGWRGWILVNQNNHGQTMVRTQSSSRTSSPSSTRTSSLILPHPFWPIFYQFHVLIPAPDIPYQYHNNRLKQQVGSDLSQASLFVKLIPINSFEDEGSNTTYTLLTYIHTLIVYTPLLSYHSFLLLCCPFSLCLPYKIVSVPFYLIPSNLALVFRLYIWQ